MAKIISLASQKGGVGKSVSAVNLAYAFAIGGYKILLIDFDSQGSVRTSLGIQDSKAMGTKELLTKSHIPLEKLISKLREQNQSRCTFAPISVILLRKQHTIFQKLPHPFLSALSGNFARLHSIC